MGTNYYRIKPITEEQRQELHKTFGDLYREFIYIKEQLNGMEIPLTIDGKEVDKVELLDNPIRLEIKTKNILKNIKEKAL